MISKFQKIKRDNKDKEYLRKNTLNQRKNFEVHITEKQMTTRNNTLLTHRSVVEVTPWG